MPRHDVLVPRLSDTMVEGTLVRWVKQIGETVAKGDELVEIDTDKVSVTIEAEAEGVLVEAHAHPGETVPVGSVIAVIASGSDAKVDEEKVRAEHGAVATRSIDKPDSIDSSDQSPDKPDSPDKRNGFGVDDGHEEIWSRRVRATPLARKLAANVGLDLNEIHSGSGPEGRILRHDVQRAMAQRARHKVSAEQDTVIEPTRAQLTIAQRMTHSKQNTPHYYVDTEVDVTSTLELQAQLRELEPPVEVSLTVFSIRAVALALREFSFVNGSWLENQIILHPTVNVGFAVALEDGGLIVPVIRNADAKGLHQVATEVEALTASARERTLKPEEVQNASFTVSNLGMYGVHSFHAIIDPPQSGILAVAMVTRRPAFKGDAIVPREVMEISLSADHRLYSGVTAANFLGAVRRRLEQPLSLLV